MLLDILGKPSMGGLLVRARLSYLRRVCRHPGQALFLLLTGRVKGRPLPWVAQLISDFTILRNSARYHNTRLPGVDADFINPFDYVETFDTSSKRAKYVVDAYRYGCK